MENLAQYYRIKTYGRRASRLSTAQHQYYQLRNHIRIRDVYYFDNPSKLNDTVFQNQYQPPVLEIGAGMGHATIQYALHHPYHNIIACELYPAGVAVLLHTIQMYQLTNLYIFEGDIRDVFFVSTPHAAVTGTHIFFPDPWPKIRHRKRRLISQEFMRHLYAITVSYGYCAITTDYQDYATNIYDYALATGFVPYALQYPQLYTRWRSQTKYEQKAISNQRTCYHHIFYKPIT